ncbi:MAG: glycosyltransferase family 2 protein [Sphingomonadaceae bacterium]
MTRISIIIVSWNTKRLLERCLESVFGSACACDLEVLVVDNGSSDGSPEMVASRFPSVHLVAESENLGFARANNLAMDSATGDYLLFLNPDTELLGTALAEMVRYAEEHPDVAVVGPQLLNSDGSLQSSRRRFPTRASAFLESTVLQRWLPTHPALRHLYALDAADDQIQEVDWVVGAGFLVNAQAARQVGKMDEGYFMYSEELDWCRRFKAAGWKVVYLPTAKLVHHGGQSSGQDLLHRHIRFQHSKCRYFEKYHGRSFAQLLRVFLLANYLFLLAEDLAKLLLLRRNRSMRRRRIGTLARVVAWQIRWVARWGAVTP